MKCRVMTSIALPYVLLLKLVGRGCVPGLEVLWKACLRFLDECHLAFCCSRFSSQHVDLKKELGKLR